MNKRVLETFIKPVIPKLFAFTYSLLGNKQEASHIVIDSVVVVFIKVKDIQQTEDIEIRLFKQVYAQLQMISSRGEDSPYNNLDLFDRAILFLKERTHLSPKTIAKILDIKEYEYMVKVSLARNNILKHLGHNKDFFNFYE